MQSVKKVCVDFIFFRDGSRPSCKITSPLCHKGALLAHVQPGVHQDAKLLSCWMAPSLYYAWIYSFPNLALLFVGLHKAPVEPISAAFWGPSGWQQTPWHMSHSSQFGASSKHAEGAFCPIVQVINEDIKQGSVQNWLLRHTVSDLQLHVTDDPLGLDIQQVSIRLTASLFCIKAVCGYARK